LVKNKKLLEKFERDLIRKTPANFKKNRKIFEELYKHAVRLKVFPTRNKLEGIGVKIKLARAINNVR